MAASTVADFERDQRTPVANNLAAIRTALETAGVQFLAGGATVGPRRAVAKVSGPGLVPIRWIDATDLGHWADRRDGQDTLPELISRLILAGLGKCVHLRFPSGDSVQVGGWDGVCETEEGNQYVPEGWSRWEFGAQRTKIKQKADSDYNLRTNQPQGVDLSQTTFAFVTPRRWKAREVWSRKRTNENKWKAVRVYDADDLVHWIEIFPQVGHWLAVRIGKRPPGLRQLDEVWREWSLSTRWPMSPDLVLAGRDEEAARVLRWIHGEPTVQAVEGHSPQEAMAFLHAAASQLPPEYRAFHQARCLVAANAESARALAVSRAQLVIVLEGGDAGLAMDLVREGHHVYIPHGSTVSAPDDVIRLSRPSGDVFSQALAKMGLEKDDAEKLTRESTRSLSVLRRLIPSAPQNSAPEWADRESARGMIPMLLAGSWNEGQEADKKVLEQLSGEAYDNISARLARWADVPDSPFRRAGDTWKVASPRDVWFQLASQISSVDLDRFVRATTQVLGSHDPRFEMKSEERWMSSIRGQKPAHSSLLRSGLAESLVLLSVFGDQVKTVSNASTRADSVVRQLLDGAGAERWWSLSGQLRTLAEASPEAFLDALEASVDRADTPVITIFKEDAGSWGCSHHSELLWGLEELAWSSRYLGRVVGLLGTLARLDPPGGKYANRPKNSLLGIFRLWMPQTSAGLNERLLVLDCLRKSEPEIAWQLMISLLPGTFDSAMQSPQSRWRDFATDKPEPVTFGLIGKGTVGIATRLLEDVQASGTRWRTIFEVYAKLPLEMRAQVIAQFLAVSASIPTKDRLEIWATLRALLHHHRAFPDAQWALPEEQLADVERVYNAVGPAGFVERCAWLFAMQANLPNPASNDWRADEKTSSDLRRNVIEHLLARGDAETILGLADAAETPQLVGVATVEAAGRVEWKDQILISALWSGENARFNLAYGMIGAFCREKGETWAVDFLKRSDLRGKSKDELIRMLLLMPASKSIWDSIPQFGKDVEEGYWSRVGTLGMSSESTAKNFAIEKFLSAGRARAAIFLIGPNGKESSSEMLVRILTQAAKEPWPENSNSNDVTMFVYRIETLLKCLDETDDVSQIEIAGLEWLYFPVLKHSLRPPVNLHAVMASNPEFFVEVLSAVYRPPGEDENSVEATSEQTQAKAGQAHSLLRSWDRVPGLHDGAVDGVVLEDWVKRARKLCANAGIGSIADQQIGNVLASAPADADGIWPAKQVRELIEATRSKDLELGILIGIQNNRGVTRRGLMDGGAQERSIAKHYRDWARATELEWHRTSALLERVAKSYEEHGQWHDQNAERTDWSL